MLCLCWTLVVSYQGRPRRVRGVRPNRAAKFRWAGRNFGHYKKLICQFERLWCLYGVGLSCQQVPDSMWAWIGIYFVTHCNADQRTKIMAKCYNQMCFASIQYSKMWLRSYSAPYRPHGGRCRVGRPVAAPDHKIKQCIQRSALFPGRADRGTEGPERGAKCQSAEKLGLKGHHRPPHLEIWGLCPQENFSKIKFEMAHFLQLCKLKWSHMQCRQGFRL